MPVYNGGNDLENNFVKTTYLRRETNIGYPKNLISVIKISKEKYIMPLCGDSLPERFFIIKYLPSLKKII